MSEPWPLGRTSTTAVRDDDPCGEEPPQRATPFAAIRPAVPVKSSEGFGRVLKLVRIDVTTTDGHPPKGRTSRERTVSTLVPGECYLPDGPTGTLRLPRYIGRRSTGETVAGGVHRREVGRNVVFIYQTVRADHSPPDRRSREPIRPMRGPIHGINIKTMFVIFFSWIRPRTGNGGSGDA
jgi:hypothetical protein